MAVVKADTIDEIRYESPTGTYVNLGSLKKRDSDDDEEEVGS